MPQDDAYLVDILESARLALTYVTGKTREEFLDDPKEQDAVIRRLAIIGEAARRISEQTRAALPDVPWKAMVGMRNIVIHQYDSVDLLLVWDVLQDNLAPLIAALEKLVPPEES
jgi:uncharacterized protein with HEPN domain